MFKSNTYAASFVQQAIRTQSSLTPPTYTKCCLRLQQRQHRNTAPPTNRITTSGSSRRPLPIRTVSELNRPKSMASTSSPDPAIQEILDFWFSLTPKEWFVGSTELDKPITSRFGHLVEKARLTNELDETWLSSPSGSLALIILLDQFTRNIYRVGNHPEPGLSWSGDAKALRIATQSISKGFDRKLEQENAASHPKRGVVHRIFFYLPFMHAEDIMAQVASCALFENLRNELKVYKLQKKLEGQEESEHEKQLTAWLDASNTSAKAHIDCVAALGRFPKRNEPLGRETSEDERKFLKEHPHGF